MQRLELTLGDPVLDLALDDALLEEAETGQGPQSWLRIWEPDAPLVVIGRSSRIDEEVNRPACRQLGVPVLRRASGGASIVAGPGCLMYAVVLSFQEQAHLRMIDAAHRYVLGRLLERLQPRFPGVELLGTSDLVLEGRKFSGNSLRCRRTHLLYHGTLLYDFPLELIERCLLTPPRQPEYREGRPHLDFVRNLPLSGEELREALREAWPAELAEAWPEETTRRLAAEKYGNAVWNERL